MNGWVRSISIAVAVVALAALVAACDLEKPGDNETFQAGQANNRHFYNGVFTEYGGLFSPGSDTKDWWTIDTRDLKTAGYHVIQVRVPKGTPPISFAVTGDTITFADTVDCSHSSQLCTKDFRFHMAPKASRDIEFFMGAHTNSVGYGFTLQPG